MCSAKYPIYVAFACAMAAMCSLSDAKAQSTIAPPKCVSAVVVQTAFGYNVRFHNNCEYTVTVYWGPNLGNGEGIIQSRLNIPSISTTESETKSSEIADIRYFSCPASNYKLTYKTSLGVTVTTYAASKNLVCWRPG